MRWKRNLGYGQALDDYSCLEFDRKRDSELFIYKHIYI